MLQYEQIQQMKYFMSLYLCCIVAVILVSCTMSELSFNTSLSEVSVP